MKQFAQKMDDKKPYLAMILVQIICAGMNILAKAAFNGGLNTFVFVFYRQAIASVILAPLAIIFGRKSAPPLPFKLIVKIFVLALLGFTFNLNLQSIAIDCTTATVASATTNLIPAFTFILAILFRIETVKLRRPSGLAKVTGLILSAVGVMVIAFYKGLSLESFNHSHPIFHGRSRSHHCNESLKNSWIIGSFILLFVAFLWALWTVLLGMIMKEYPSRLWATTQICLFSTLQSFLVAIAFERNLSNWKLHWDAGLLAVAYHGVLVACLVLYLQTWVVEKKGPAFVAMFVPLAFVITITCSSFLLGEVTYLGSALGGALMIGGLYTFLWGKSTERKDSGLPVEIVP